MDAIEEAVKLAMTKPESRSEFYHTILESPLFIPHGNTPEELKIVNGRLTAGVELKLLTIAADGHDWHPVFSSMENLAKAMTQQTRYVRMRGRDFLEIVQGAYVVLNPGGYGKNFLPEEIDSMLSGAIFTPETPRRIVTKKPEKVLLGQPSNYPTRLVEALKVAFARYPTIKAAYLAHCFIPSYGTSPHTAIGIDADNYDSVVIQIGPAVNAALEHGQVVDFVSIREGGAIADYMLKQTKPFYGVADCTPATSKPGFWKRLFGSR